MPVFRPFLVELNPRPSVTPKAVPVAYFLPAAEPLPHYPPRRHDALRYALGPETHVLGTKIRITLHSKTGLPDETRTGLLGLRVLWLELIDQTLILHTKNKPERFDGGWAVFPDGQALLDEERSHKPGSLSITSWEPLRLGPRLHLRGLNGTAIDIAPPNTHDQGPAQLACETNGELRLTTAAEVARRAAAHPLSR